MSANQNLNIARSDAMRQRLIEATVDALVTVGYAKTTGVEVCKRAGVTRGALNHHFPSFVSLLIATLNQIYASVIGPPQQVEGNLNGSAAGTAASLEALVQATYQSVIHPQFKAVIELWLASRNDNAIGAALTQAITAAAEQFAPAALLPNVAASNTNHAMYHTLKEALIGIGLGRATNGGEPSAHEPAVLATLLQLARQQDTQGDTREPS